jgi:hypothetical protein
MNAMTIDPATLCLRINEGFGKIPYPGDEHIVIDNTGSHLECEKIKGALKDRHWRDVSFETIEQLRTALPFFSPAGYRFYLPAYMVFSVVHFPRAGIIPDEVIRSLTSPSASDIDRVGELADLTPEMQPFASDEWVQILKTVAETYRSGEPEKVFFERVSGFAAAQAQVIREFLEYMRDFHGEEFPNREPEIALERYWYEF